MTIPDENNIQAFPSPEALDSWLASHHQHDSELWVKIYKKHTKIPSVTWDDVVLSCLCWGWIDGIKKSLDEQSYLQRITPRKKKSVWSKRNTEHVAVLQQTGRMQPAGMLHVEAAKADGRWDAAYVASEVTIPQDFLDSVAASSAANKTFKSLTKSNRFVIAHGLNSAKRDDTRHRRFERYLDQLNKGDTPK